MLKVAAFFSATLAIAAANAISIYDCTCPSSYTSYSSPCAAPVAPLPAPAPAPVTSIPCIPSPPPSISCSNLQTIITLLTTLKNAGLIQGLPGTPGGPTSPVSPIAGLLTSPQVVNNPLLFIKLLNLLTVSLGGSTVTPPSGGNSTAPAGGLPLGGLPLGGSDPSTPTGLVPQLLSSLGLLNGTGAVPSLLQALLGGPSGSAATPDALSPILLQLIASLIPAQCPQNPCPCPQNTYSYSCN